MTDYELTECIDGLTDATSESEAVFYAAAGDVRSEEARTLLLDRAQRFGRAAAALRALADERGVALEAGASLSSPNRLPPADEAGILAACEQREESLIIDYRDALEHGLPDPVRRVIAREFENLLACLGTLGVTRDRAARQQRLIVGRPV
jgi:hypothetical protein